MLSAGESLALGLAAVAAYWWAGRWPQVQRFGAVPLLVLFAFVGLTLPDIDQPLPLEHRSGLTHSLLPALPWLVWRWLRPVAAGVALGLGAHLAADLFPEAMVGFATIKLPGAGSIERWSYLWIGLNLLGATWLGGRLLAGEVADWRLRLLVLVGCLGLALWYFVVREGAFLALILYAAVAWTMLLKRGWLGPRP